MADISCASEAPGEFRCATGTTFHICAREHWTKQQHLTEYEPEQFAKDGFVHCTDDSARLMEIANLFYLQDRRPYLALEIDLGAVPALTLYEDEADEFPHIYGRVPLSSVKRVVAIERGDDGTFLRVSAEAHGSRG